jgi:hypothetical protein
MPEQVIKFSYERDPSYAIVPATGVWGAVTPAGMVMFDLTVDHIRSPDRLEHSLQDGKLGPETGREPSERIVRRAAQVGVLVTPAVAESIGKWLIQKAEEARNRAAKQSPGTPASS